MLQKWKHGDAAADIPVSGWSRACSFCLIISAQFVGFLYLQVWMIFLAGKVWAASLPPSQMLINS